MEIWKPIKGFEGLYEVSNYGNVRRVSRYGRRWVHPCSRKLTKDGYYETALVKDNKYKFVRTHRLVAAAFCENPHNKKEVNHKDGNKLNNCADNLEWCTSSENQIHAYKMGLQKVSGGAISNRKKLRCEELDITTDSITEMQKLLNAMGLTRSMGIGRLSDVVNNGTNKYLGLHFYFV